MVDFKNPFLSNLKSIHVYRMARVKSRRNRRPSKRRTRRVSKRRMGRTSKRRMGRTSKRRRRFQRGGMEKEMNPVGPDVVPTTIQTRQRIEPFPMIYTNATLPAISVDLFDPNIDQKMRYDDLLMMRATQYQESLVGTIRGKIKQLQGMGGTSGEIQRKLALGQTLDEGTGIPREIMNKIQFEFIDVVGYATTYSLKSPSVPDKRACGRLFEEGLQFFEIIVLIHPLKYIVIRDTYDVILQLYSDFDISWIKRKIMKGNVLQQGKTIFEAFVENWWRIRRSTTHPDGVPLDSVKELRELLPPYMTWGIEQALYGMDGAAIDNFRREYARRNRR